VGSRAPPVVIEIDDDDDEDADGVTIKKGKSLCFVLDFFVDAFNKENHLII
jgi:hypothetical protein